MFTLYSCAGRWPHVKCIGQFFHITQAYSFLFHLETWLLFTELTSSVAQILQIADSLATHYWLLRFPRSLKLTVLENQKLTSWSFETCCGPIIIIHQKFFLLSFSCTFLFSLVYLLFCFCIEFWGWSHGGAVANSFAYVFFHGLSFVFKLQIHEICASFKFSCR